MHSEHHRIRLFFIVLITVFSALAPAVLGQTFTFTNATPIIIPVTTGAASPYSSNISVSGYCCSVTKATVTLKNFTHTQPDDVGVLLVAPGGQKIRLMTDNGGTTDAIASTITFDDNASVQIGDNGGIPSGTYRPGYGASSSSGDGSTHGSNFASPAPSNPYSSMLSDLLGSNPNGTWSLYVDDDTTLNGGVIAEGWTLNLTIGRTYTNAASIAVPGTGTGPATASFYPSDIAVSGIRDVVTRVTVKLNNFSHTYWDDVAVILVGPQGQKVLLTSDNGGSNDATGSYIFDDSAATVVPNNGAVPPGSYRPSPDGTNDGGSEMQTDFPSPAPSGPYSGALSDFNGLNPNGTWSLYVYDDSSADSGSIAGGWSLTFEVLGTTAAPVTVTGRVLNARGSGISGAQMVLSGGELEEPRVAMTNPFGYYSFTDIPSGATYIIGVSSKRYFFAEPVKVVSAYDSISDLDFIASP